MIDKHKFDENGVPIAYYGNTIISFINTEAFQAYELSKRIQSEIKELSFANKLAFLPPESFHMTILSLARERDRHTQFWSTEVPNDAKFKEVDKKLKEMMDKIEFPHNIMIEIESCEINKMVLKPLYEEDAKRLKMYRDLIAKETGIRHPWHDGFKYHITLCYSLEELDEEEEKEKEEFCNKKTKELLARSKPFLLPSPEFVIFNDMMSYEADLNKRGTLY